MNNDFCLTQRISTALMDYLGCRCAYFAPMEDDTPIINAYLQAREEGAREGFVPMLVKVDEILLEYLIMNACPGPRGRGDYAFDPEKVALYRREALETPLERSEAVLKEMAGRYKRRAAQDASSSESGPADNEESGEANDLFSSYWDPFSRKTFPLILAKVPVKNPWEIFAYLPFGGWNDCPDTPQLMAAAKCWFEQYGAMPALVTHDTLEFELPAPVPAEKALALAAEQYGFCPDVDQGVKWSLDTLAAELRRSTVWYFWWD